MFARTAHAAAKPAAGVRTFSQHVTIQLFYSNPFNSKLFRQLDNARYGNALATSVATSPRGYSSCACAHLGLV